MAALLPIISEILPMIMPSSISVTKASDVFPPTLHVAPDTTTEQQNGSPSSSVEKDKTKRPGIKVISRDAMVNKTDKMCASVLILPPKSTSTIRHNGEQDAIIYAALGSGILLSSPKDDEEPIAIAVPKPNGTKDSKAPKAEESIIQEPQPVRYPLEKGDFAFIPAWTEHQALNESDTEDAVWVVTRSGSSPVEVHLTDWGGAEVKAEQGPSSSSNFLKKTLFNI
ncbi:hypothetical protein QBC37DRAFT_369974 [Rhypophila decipiens]|uniref:Cupin 2 conserved barrel domain-containing protein n=1 Tax=Rhypophila decipiens TaxID=261697 RepID=A0AAN6YH29_9PEZI|nr:hypothetical protein QBC37DRAFT_369974 [Rhypophila decipiens]